MVVVAPAKATERGSRFWPWEIAIVNTRIKIGLNRFIAALTSPPTLEH